MADNKLYYGDNLDILRKHIRDESVALVYLDPPFKEPPLWYNPGTAGFSLPNNCGWSGIVALVQ